MAFTRPMYGTCATKKHVEESTSVLSYLMDPNKYYNCNPCRIELGVVGGNNVSLYGGNLVDLDSELSGRTRAFTHCPAGLYLPGTVIQGQENYSCGPECGANGLPCGNASCRKEKLHHLSSCNIVQYPPRPTGVGYELKHPPCPTLGYTPHAKKAKRHRARANVFAPVEWQGQQGDRLAQY